MTVQLSIYTNTQHGEQATRSLSRRTDPITSKTAAKVAVLRLDSDESAILAILREYGPQTIREIASHSDNSSRMYFVAAKRLPRMARAGLVMLVHDREGREVVRDGGRVWEACE